MGFESQKLLIGMIMTLILGQVTTQSTASAPTSTGDDVCEKCVRGQFLSPCSSYGYCNSFYGSDVIPIDDEFFLLHEVDDVKCSEINNGTEFEKLKERLEKIVRAEKKRPRSIWPCLKHQGWRGYDCSDGQASRQEHEQLLELLLLTLTNVLFIPAIILALYRRHFVEALVYTFTMTFSGLYHACDGNRTDEFKYCPLRINILSIADFLGSALCIWVTLVAMARPPKKLKAVLQMAGPLGLLFGVLYKKTSVFLFIAPAGLGLLMIFISWVCRCCYRHKCYPTIRKYLLCLLPGILLAVGGICIFTFVENKDNYLYVHSGWHACMALCIVFLLPPRERKGDYKVRQANNINLGSTYQPIRPAEDGNYVI